MAAERCSFCRTQTQLGICKTILRSIIYLNLNRMSNAFLYKLKSAKLTYQSSHDGLFWKNVLLRIWAKSLKNKCEGVHYFCYMTDHVFEKYLRILQLKIKKIGRGPYIHFFIKELYNFFWTLQFLRVPNFELKVFLR